MVRQNSISDIKKETQFSFTSDKHSCVFLLYVIQNYERFRHFDLVSLVLCFYIEACLYA